jgi:hypothetical protein
MSRLLIIKPLPVVSISTSRGSGVGNVLTPDPKEVWADNAIGAAATLTVDLGANRLIDTIFLGYVRAPSAEATWSITADGGSPQESVLQPIAPLRVPDSGGHPALSHALWHGPASWLRYLTITINQPTGAPLSAGVLVVGKALEAELGREWGWGRQPVDTGVATPLPSGGFSVVEGVRKVLLTWTFGDLSIEETDQLELIGLALGETKPVLVIEDADRTAGLMSRIHYGLFKRWRAFERRNRRQTRWELGIEQWI